jgi:hypothetical protein
MNADEVRAQRKRYAAGLVLLCSVCLGGWIGQGCAGATPPLRQVCTSCRIVCAECEGQDRFVRLQGITQELRRDHPPNFSHPVRLSPEDWRTILVNIRVQKEGEPFLPVIGSRMGSVEAALTPDEVDYLSRTLSKAFAQAQPTEWVVFGLRRSQSTEISEISELTTGGWYMEGPNLHLILANYRFAATAPHIQELMWANPLYTQVLSYDLVPGDYQTVVRRDDASSFKNTPKELAIAYQPLLLGVSQQAAEKNPAAAASTPPPTLSLEERLQTLKRLRDQGLITDEEYRIKRQQLLDRF